MALNRDIYVSCGYLLLSAVAALTVHLLTPANQYRLWGILLVGLMVLCQALRQPCPSWRCGLLLLLLLHLGGLGLGHNEALATPLIVGLHRFIEL